MTRRTPSSVLVTGASSRTGRELLEILRETPLRVRALTRSADNHESLVAAGADEVVIGDLLDPADARSAVDGCDAILFAAGSSLTTGLLRPSQVIDGDGVINLVDVALDADVHTFVFLSSIGVGNSRRGMPLWARLLVLRWTVREKERAERALCNSVLDQVIFRPGWLTHDPATVNVLIGEGSVPMTGSVPRADVARLIVAALFTAEATNRTFEVVARESASRSSSNDLVDVEWNSGSNSVVATTHG